MATKLPDLSRSLNLAFGPAWPGRLPRGFAMTDPARTPDPAGLVAALPGGVVEGEPELPESAIDIVAGALETGETGLECSQFRKPILVQTYFGLAH